MDSTSRDRVADESRERLPRWFSVGLATALVFVAATGVGGVALLVVDAFQPMVAACIGAGAAVVGGLGVASRLKGQTREGRRAANGAAVAALAVVACFLGVNAIWHSEHLLADRDPGTYVNIGRSISTNHTLTPTVRTGPFADDAFLVSSAGFYEQDGQQQTTFLPLLPVLLAVGWSLGGYTGMLIVPALIASLGLLSVYAVSARLMTQRWAVLAVSILALTPLASWFARDAYSELVVQALCLGGVWLYFEARSANAPGIAALAGALVATSLFARFDAILVVASLVVFASVEVVRSRAALQPKVRRIVAASFAGSMLVTTLYSRVLTQITSSGYLDVHTRQVRFLSFVLLGAVIFGAAAVLVHRVGPRGGISLARAQLPLFVAVAAAVIGVVAYAYFWRPTTSAEAYSLPNLFVNIPNRSAWVHAHYTWSMRWFVTWFGAFVILLGVIGMLEMFRRALRGNGPATALALIFTPTAFILLARPSVSPDQPWAMRRYLPIVIPVVVIAAVLALQAFSAIARRYTSARQTWIRITAVVMLSAAVVVSTALPSLALRRARAQHGATAAVGRLCNALPPDAAVFLHPLNRVSNDLRQPIRGFCEVPTASLASPRDLDLLALERDWQAVQRRLYVITDEPSVIIDAGDGHAVRVLDVTIDDAYAPELAYRDRPRHYTPQPRTLSLLRIDP